MEDETMAKPEEQMDYHTASVIDSITHQLGDRVMEKVCDAKHEAIDSNIIEMKTDIKSIGKSITRLMYWIAGAALTVIATGITIGVNSCS